jgi:hypothetical protein
MDVHKVTVNDIRKPHVDRNFTPTEVIKLRARGTSGSEVIRVTVNGQEISRFNLTRNWREYTATTSIFGGINVEFLNDASGRDVELDWVEVPVNRRETIDQTYNTATWGNGYCGGGTGTSEMMHCGSNYNSSHGIIGFGDVIERLNGGNTHYSYGHLSSKVMPAIATVVSEPYDSAGSTCYDIQAYNTRSSTQTIELNFEIEEGKSLVSANNFDVTSNIGGVIKGRPNGWLPRTLPPNGNANLHHIWFCVN